MNEILQGGALQVVHHHVDGFILAEKLSTLTTEGWEICASERPSSKKLFRAPSRYSDSFRVEPSAAARQAHARPKKTGGIPDRHLLTIGSSAR